MIRIFKATYKDPNPGHQQIISIFYRMNGWQLNDLKICTIIEPTCGAPVLEELSVLLM